jgi:hypothetical protein
LNSIPQRYIKVFKVSKKNESLFCKETEVVMLRFQIGNCQAEFISASKILYLDLDSETSSE